MTKMKTLTKGLLGASVFSLMAGANAFAEGTLADTTVANTFTLDYQVSGVDQPTIDTGPTGTDTPTEFTVDRLIDLTVDSLGNTTVAPDAQDQVLEFSVTNTGNDTQAYDLTLADVASDDFDTTGLVITYVVDSGPGGISDGVFDPLVDTVTGTYTLGDATPDIAPDGVLWVYVTGDIADTVTNGQTDGVTLVADTLEPTTGTTPGAPVEADTGGNTLTGAAENVLGDVNGITDGPNAGDHSASGTYIVAAANIAATKSVAILLQDGVDTATCTAAASPAVGDPLSIPGSCVEYVIEVTNAGATSAIAEAIEISDYLPAELTFVSAALSGFVTGASPAPAMNLAAPTVGTVCAEVTATPFTSNCQVLLTNATLAADVVGQVTIRALVQ